MVVIWLLCVLFAGALSAPTSNGCIEGPACRRRQPDFYSYGQPLTLVRREGQSISLNCHGGHSGSIKIDWRFNLRELDARGNDKYRLRHSSLSVHSLTLADTGIYRCEKTIEGKMFLTEFRLFVFKSGEPRPSGGPVLSETSLRVKEGERVTFNCRVPARTSAVVEWVQMIDYPYQTIPEEMPYNDMLNIQNHWKLWMISRTWYDQPGMDIGREASYTVNSVTSYQNGRHACLIIHPDGVWVKTFDLTVHPLSDFNDIEGVGATVVPAFFPFPKNNKLPLNSKHPVVVKEKQQLSIWSFVMVVCGVAAIMILLLTIGLVVARRCRDMKSPELKKDPEQIYEKIPSHGGNLVAV